MYINSWDINKNEMSFINACGLFELILVDYREVSVAADTDMTKSFNKITLKQTIFVFYKQTYTECCLMHLMWWVFGPPFLLVVFKPICLTKCSIV